MQRTGSRMLRLALVLGASLAAVSCSKDELPTTPAPPFLLTGVAISKFVTPSATTVLPANTQQKLRFDVAYTLSAADDARRSDLSVVVVAFRTDVDSVIAATSFQMSGSSGTVTDSVTTTTIPGGVPFVQLDAAVIYTPLDTIVTFSYGPYWSVK